MSKILFLSILSFSLLQCSQDKRASDNLSASPRGTSIIGGSIVTSKHKTAQYVVGLVIPKFGSCTGTLIDKNIVLTAAHCIPPNPRSMYVVFSTSLKNITSLRAASVVHAVVSPMWGKKKGNKNTGDIAVVKFQGQAPTGYVPVNILRNSHYLAPSTTTLLAGFGLDDGTTQAGSGVLREVFTVLTNPGYSQTEAILDQKEDRGVCTGDSGGPAFLLLNDVYYIWGVASRGDAKCKTTGIYTVVVPHLQFIDTVSRQLQVSF